MKVNIFGIFDEKAQAYGTPFFKPHVGQALRDFGDLARDTQSVICKHVEDYSLYHLGEFDPISGKFVSFNEPRFIARASEFSAAPVMVPNGKN